MKLFRVGDTTWYVLVDVEKKQIISQHEKTQVQATADQIASQLVGLPDPSVMEDDLLAVIGLIDASAAPQARKDRVKALLRDMWATYQDADTELVERAELRARLDRLNKLLAEMV